MNFYKESKQVYYAKGDVVRINKEHIELLKEKMRKDNLERIRVCIHEDRDSPVHEMFIVLKKGNYVRPHRHLNKSESFYLVEGRAIAFFFDKKGNILEKMELGEFNAGKQHGYRINSAIYHSVVPVSSYLVFHEVTSGPFCKNFTEYAPWAPEENTDEGKQYIKKILK